MDSPRLKAARNGEVHYEGSQCRKCGTTAKYTSTGNCVQCIKTANVEKRKKVRELLAQARETVKAGE